MGSSIPRNWGVERRPGSGRPRASTGREDRALLRHRKRNPFMSASQLRHASRFPGGRKTVGNRLKAAGIRSYRAARKQTLTEEHAIDRLAYANSLHGVDWRRVIFTDESQMSTSYAGQDLFASIARLADGTLQNQRRDALALSSGGGCLETEQECYSG